MNYEKINQNTIRVIVCFFVFMTGILNSSAAAAQPETKTEEQQQLRYFDIRMAFSEYFVDENNQKTALLRDLVAVVDENYIIGAGDKLNVMVWGKLQMLYNLEVSWDGNLIPIGPDRVNINDFFTYWPGTVSVNGKTLQQLQRLLESSFRQYIKNNVHVTVTVAHPRVVRVQIMGQVESPNVYRIPAGTSLISAVTVAGYNQSTSLRRIRIIRTPAPDEKQTIDIDLYDYFTHFNLASNPILQNDDIVQIPQVEMKAHVQGGVNRPGTYEILPGERLSELLDNAGGLRWNAVPESSYMERRGESDLVSMKQTNLTFFADRDMANAANIPIRNGDALFVQETTELHNFIKVVFDNLFGETEETIQEEKERQIIVPLAYGLTMTQLFARIKDRLTNADLKSITVVREGHSIKIDYLSMLSDPKKDFSLENGDTIYIPRAVDYIYVLGEVSAPSMIKYGRDATLLEYIAQAGGFTQNAKLAIVTILHTSPDRQSKEVIDVKQWIKTGDQPENVSLIPGDIIIVPRDSSYNFRDYVEIFNSVIPMLSFLELRK